MRLGEFRASRAILNAGMLGATPVVAVNRMCRS